MTPVETSRQEKALREFKEVIADLVTLLRHSTGVSTAWICWVNRARKQFVMEASSTIRPDVMFRDRIPFGEHFLASWKESREIVRLRPEVDLKREELNHYHEGGDVRSVTIVPIVNNNQTVALTILESESPDEEDPPEALLRSYINALGNVLNTYLELSELQEKEKEWSGYEEVLERFSPRQHRVEVLDRMVREMKRLIPDGGVSLVARGMGIWVNVLNAPGSIAPPPIGEVIDDLSLAYEVLNSGSPGFAIHYNKKPKRIAADEEVTDGATLAIPLLIDDRRQGVVLAYSRNAMAFNEATRHKLVNLARVSLLSIRAAPVNVAPVDDLLTSDHGSFLTEVWESTIRAESETANPIRKTWFGLITVENQAELRSRHRLETLVDFQRELVTVINPSRHGFAGYIGFYSDYLYTFLLQDVRASAPEEWLTELSRLFERPLRLPGGEEFPVVIRSGYDRVGKENEELHELVRRAKTALDRAVRESRVWAAPGV